MRYLIALVTISALSSSVASAQCDDPGASAGLLVVGITLSPKLAFLGGIEGRLCVGPQAEAFVRLEYGGHLHVVAGARLRLFAELVPVDPQPPRPGCDSAATSAASFPA